MASGAGRVSVIIKALNEEARIAAAIESALAAPLVGEVVVADSLSSDATVAIAQSYPVTVVQLSDPMWRSCGLGAQLGWPYARGELVYLLDGDMCLLPGFLEDAVARLDAEPRLAGVAGRVNERIVVNPQFRRRRRQALARGASLDELALGGLYRRTALEDIGYCTNLNLHSFEELELGLRLRRAGWRLARIDTPALDHFGPRLSGLALLRRHLATRYLEGSGELTRAAFGEAYFVRVLWRFGHLWGALAWWLSLVGGIALLPWTPWPLLGAGAIGASFFALATWDSGLRDGAFRLAHWQVHAAAMVRGLLRAQRDPRAPIPHRVVQRA